MVLHVDTDATPARRGLAPAVTGGLDRDVDTGITLRGE